MRYCATALCQRVFMTGKSRAPLGRKGGAGGSAVER
jgi:hypothetical protein